MESSKTETMEIIAFGVAARIIGAPRISWPYIRDTAELRAALIHRYPGLRNVPFILAVNRDVSPDEQTIPPGATVAVLPPYSGG
ncbi:MAG: MoaD/ThiS family protein [Saprospiraceae bacterium]|nr:MoaD/ThiS family protein [Saprospiraceae bacterium]